MIRERWKSQFDNLDKELNSFRKQREKRLDANSKLREIMALHLNETNKITLDIVKENQKLLELKDNEKILLEKSAQQMIEGAKDDEKDDKPQDSANEVEVLEAEEVDRKQIGEK